MHIFLIILEADQPPGKGDKADKQAANAAQLNEKSEKEANDEKVEFWKNQ